MIRTLSFLAVPIRERSLRIPWIGHGGTPISPFSSPYMGGAAVSERLAFGLDPASPTLLE